MDRYLERGCRSLRLFTSVKLFDLVDLSRGIFPFYVDVFRSCRVQLYVCVHYNATFFFADLVVAC